jgi:hypothetical protein
MGLTQGIRKSKEHFLRGISEPLLCLVIIYYITMLLTL